MSVSSLLATLPSILVAASALGSLGCGGEPELRTGDSDALAALDYARQTLSADGPDQALAILGGARSQYPDSLEVAREYARLAASLSRLDAAIEAYEDLLDSDPSDVVAARELLQVALFIGDEARVERARAALAAQPDLGWTDLALLARVAAERGDPATALELGRRAVAAGPDGAEAHWQVANALLQLDREDEAETHLLRAVELDPGHGGAQFALGTWLTQAGGDPAAGAAHLQRSEAVRMLGTQRFGRADAEERLATAREVTRLHPDWSRGWIEAAKAQLELGRPRKAGAFLDRAGDLAPPPPELTHLRWEVATATGDSATAAQLALELRGPEEPER